MTLIRRPLHTSMLGFDRFLEEVNKAIDATEKTNQFPPFNLLKVFDGYVIEMALAGFKKEDIQIQHDKKNSTLKISGTSNKTTVPDSEVIHQGIASRQFSRAFTVAENLEVESAKMEDGVLAIKLKLIEREEDKPLLITVS